MTLIDPENCWIWPTGDEPTLRLVDSQWRTGEHPAHVGDWVARLGDGRHQVLADDDFRVEWMAAQ